VTKHYNKITDVEFCPAAPYDFAVSTSTRVLICDATTTNVKRTISRFKDVAYGASFRRDGKLLVAGGEDKKVKVFDTASR
jgi:U3 small nucleolar RNA-associated protein 15